MAGIRQGALILCTHCVHVPVGGMVLAPSYPARRRRLPPLHVRGPHQQLAYHLCQGQLCRPQRPSLPHSPRRWARRDVSYAQLLRHFPHACAHRAPTSQHGPTAYGALCALSPRHDISMCPPFRPATGFPNWALALGFLAVSGGTYFYVLRQINSQDLTAQMEAEAVRQDAAEGRTR